MNEIITGDQLLGVLRAYVSTFPCACEYPLRGDNCLSCKAEEMIEILEPPKPTPRGMLVRLTLFSPSGPPLYSVDLVNTDLFRYDLDVDTKISGLSVEFR